MHCLQLLAVVWFPWIDDVLHLLPQTIANAVDTAVELQCVCTLLLLCTAVQFQHQIDQFFFRQHLRMQNQVRRRVVQDVVHLFLCTLMGGDGGMENGALKFAIARLIPECIVHLSGVDKNHLSLLKRAGFSVNAVPHSSAADVDKFKVVVPVVDNRERGIVLLPGCRNFDRHVRDIVANDFGLVVHQFNGVHNAALSGQETAFCRVRFFTQRYFL